MRHELEYVAVRSVASAVRAMSPRGVRIWGSRLGLAFYAVDPAHRRIALANLAAAFPIRPPRERRVLAQQMFGHFGRMLLELLKYSTLPDERKLELVEWDGEERVRLAYAQGRGVLFCTGHFGCWEQQAIAHALKFEPMAVLARPLDNPKLHAMLEQVRTCTGNSVIYRHGAVRRVMRLLAAGHGVGILIDQHMNSPDAVSVNFFGRPAATTSTLAALAMRTGSPVVPLFALPLADGRYRMIYEHPVEPARADAPDAIRDFTQRCTDVLEMYVRRHPELWLWMHRRWRDGSWIALDQSPGMFPSAKQDVEADT